MRLELTDEFGDTLEVDIKTVDVDDDSSYKAVSVDGRCVHLNKDQIEGLIEYLQKAKEELS